VALLFTGEVEEESWLSQVVCSKGMEVVGVVFLIDGGQN
jgi:hypothetical protein